MTHPDKVKAMIEGVGGVVDEESIHVLPDGTGGMTASFPLPDDHWLTQPGYEPPPMPFRMGTDDPRRALWAQRIREAGRYAVRATTTRGTIDDFDPDAWIQNLVVALLGYHTPDGLAHDSDVPEFDPNPVPPIWKETP